MFDDAETYDPQELADREQRARDVARSDKAQFLSDLAFVLSTETGRRLFAGIKEMSRGDLPSFDANPYVTAWNEGRRSLDIDLTALVSRPELQHAYEELLKEAHDRRCKRSAYIAG